MAQIVPLTSSPSQELTVALNVDGATLRLQLSIYFNEMAQYWAMDIADAKGNPLIASIPLVTGNWPAANVLSQYGYLAIGSAFVIKLGQADSDYPAESELGTSYALLWDNTPGWVG